MKFRSSRFHSGTAIPLSMFLRLSRRICHASPAVRGYCIGRRWRGCHNSTASYRTCAAGFPPSLWEAVRKYHCSPYRSRRSRSHSGLQGIRWPLGQLVLYSPLSKAVVPAPLPIPLLYGFRTRNTVCSIFKVQRDMEKNLLSPHNGHFFFKCQPSHKNFFALLLMAAMHLCMY